MSRYFTHYWKKDTCDYHYDVLKFEGRPLDHTPGDSLIKRGAAVGDLIYVVTMRDGRLFLVGKMQVGKIINSDEEAEACIGYEPWPAFRHLIAKSCTPMHFNRSVPLSITRCLRFRTSSGVTLLKFRPEDRDKLDPQTLRTPRELTPGSATELDGLLESMSEMKFSYK
jgi:hypothetical protein